MNRIKYLALLHVIIFVYSLSAVCSKFASGLPFFSFKWCALYALIIFILGVYAILWQQILKKMPLNLAYANKSLTLAWGMIFGALIFRETITPQNVIGAITVLVGVILMVTTSGKPDELPQENAIEGAASEKNGGDSDE